MADLPSRRDAALCRWGKSLRPSLCLSPFPFAESCRHPRVPGDVVCATVGRPHLHTFRPQNRWLPSGVASDDVAASLRWNRNQSRRFHPDSDVFCWTLSWRAVLPPRDPHPDREQIRGRGKQGSNIHGASRA